MSNQLDATAEQRELRPDHHVGGDAALIHQRDRPATGEPDERAERAVRVVAAVERADRAQPEEPDLRRRRAGAQGPGEIERTASSSGARRRRARRSSAMAAGIAVLRAAARARIPGRSTQPLARAKACRPQGASAPVARSSATPARHRPASTPTASSTCARRTRLEPYADNRVDRHGAAHDRARLIAEAARAPACVRRGARRAQPRQRPVGARHRRSCGSSTEDPARQRVRYALRRRRWSTSRARSVVVARECRGRRRRPASVEPAGAVAAANVAVAGRPGAADRLLRRERRRAALKATSPALVLAVPPQPS